jgi:hypothetical protein
MQAEVVKADQGVQIAEDMQMHLLRKQPVMQHQLKFQQKQMQKQSRLMQMQKHQQLNGCNWWCHFSKDNQKQKHIDFC